ncbi:hypothetical protein D7X88_05180 [bacterium C-53]|nr:hypothetical protein [Lachnospiraceae bacterium]NBI02618.1 hypothetical protein [Lachnospiraceae bacterium]RKJ11259.1 hypothetical protein D7X88_05180 [bacterium C-53]
MSPEILEQLQILFHFFLLGIVITLVYDVLRLLRYLIPHNHAVIAGEDLIFWIVTGFVVFDMFLRESNGSIRFFSIGGAVLGMLLKNKLTGSLKPDRIKLYKHKDKKDEKGKV